MIWLLRPRRTQGIRGGADAAISRRPLSWHDRVVLLQRCH